MTNTIAWTGVIASLLIGMYSVLLVLTIMMRERRRRLEEDMPSKTPASQRRSNPARRPRVRVRQHTRRQNLRSASVRATGSGAVASGSINSAVTGTATGGATGVDAAGSSTKATGVDK